MVEQGRHLSACRLIVGVLVEFLASMLVGFTVDMLAIRNTLLWPLVLEKKSGQSRART